MSLSIPAALFVDGAPAAPAPPPGSHPYGRINDMPARSPNSAPDISDPAPLGRRMARIQFSSGTDFCPTLH